MEHFSQTFNGKTRVRITFLILYVFLDFILSICCIIFGPIWPWARPRAGPVTRPGLGKGAQVHENRLFITKRCFGSILAYFGSILVLFCYILVLLWPFIDSLILKNVIGTAPHATFLCLIFCFYFYIFGRFRSKFGSGTPPRGSGTTNSIGFRPSFIQFRPKFPILKRFLNREMQGNR